MTKTQTTWTDADEDAYVLNLVTKFPTTRDGKDMLKNPNVKGMPVTWLLIEQGAALRRLVAAGKVEIVMGGRDGDRPYMVIPS